MPKQPTMLRRLRLVPLCAFLPAAADSLLVRRAYPHRAPDPWLVPETWVLWTALALLAMAPAALLARAWTRRAPAGERRFALALLGLTAGPVAVHGVLDRYTSLGGDVSALAAPGPWLRVAGLLVLVLALAVGLDRLAQRLKPARLLATGLLLALGLAAWATFGGAPPRDAVAAAPAAGHPNLLFLVWDTTRAQSLAPYGAPRETTPHLARLMDDALVFRNARSASVFTLSSHLSMLTGVHPSDHGASLTRQFFDPRRTPTVAMALRQAGYRTGGFVGTDVLRADTGIVEGFERYDDATDPPVTYTRAWALVHDLQSIAASRVRALQCNGNPHWIQDYQRPAEEVLSSALRWIREGQRRGDPRPWFCFVNLYDVHWPYVPSEPWRGQWVEDYDGPVDGYLFRSDNWQPGYELTETDKRHLSQLYDGEMAHLDWAVDEFLQALEAEGGPFALLMTADHGEAFGEAGRYEHYDILEPQVHVPLVVRSLERDAPRGWIDTPVSGVDVAPTLLALAGVDAGAEWRELAEPSGGLERGGRNLLELARESRRGDRPILVEGRDKMDPSEFRIALYQGPWKLVRNGVGQEATWHLYEHETDPLEQHDRAADEPQVVADLRERMERWRSLWQAVDEVGPGGANADALNALGYTDGGRPPGQRP